ncbi:UPF0598 protein CG30010 [Coccinella septempunctata]|uniref:UPF0598 protein CG30010 n=1 Tax=Coccinella septempunctata TaxID=41139 RepID=UPI001D06CE04|nr:UPF0598 protein CG30010 [Coccinella septempunctata]
MMLKGFISDNYLRHSYPIFTRKLSYIQGQEPERHVREYFYYIDHQGMLFLDDSKMKNFTSCIKEKKFLRFFFNQLKQNDTNRYTEFPYLSKCGKERNFVRCDDCPFVFTHILKMELSNSQPEMHLAYNHANSLLTLKFQPDKVIMLPETGRVYHPAPDRVGSVGLIQSKLAIMLSEYFHFGKGENNPPTMFTFMGKTYVLDNTWYQNKHIS